LPGNPRDEAQDRSRSDGIEVGEALAVFVGGVLDGLDPYRSMIAV